jgi:hypothetical protein
MSDLQKLDAAISDLIDTVDVGVLNDIFLDAVLNPGPTNTLSVVQKRAILKFVLDELETIEKDNPEIMESEPIEIIHKKNITV